MLTSITDVLFFFAGVTTETDTSLADGLSVTEVITVPQEKVGQVIGVKGSIIVQLQARSGAKVNLCNSNSFLLQFHSIVSFAI